MSIYEADGLVLRGQVQRSYTIQAVPDECYEFLSDIRTLLTQVPYVSKIQVGKTSGRARAFFNINVMSVRLDAVLDMEPAHNPAERTIRIKTAQEPLGAIPAGYFTGHFNALIKIRPTEKGNSRISSQIVLAFDGNQLIERGLFSRYIIETTGPTLLQEYCERLCDDYIVNLLEYFRKWQSQRRSL